MILSAEGRDFLQKWEGLELNSYQDVKGVWTIGYGHTKTAGPDQCITEEQAKSFFKEDVRWAEKAVEQLVTATINQRQFDMLVSLVYNIGASQFARSTLLRVLNEGKYLQVPQEITRWNKSGGARIKGLVRRRLAEATNWANA